MDDGWVSVVEAEQLTGKSARTLRRWAAAGKLQVQYNTEGHTLYQLSDLDTLTGHDRPYVRPDDHPVSAPLAEVVQLDDRAPSTDQAQALQMARRLGELEAEAQLMREDRDYWRAHAEAMIERAHAAELTLAQERTERSALEAERDRLTTQVSGHDRPRPDTWPDTLSTPDEPPPRPPWWRLFRRLFGGM